jgi:hypothetical protein
MIKYGEKVSVECFKIDLGHNSSCVSETAGLSGIAAVLHYLTIVAGKLIT